MAISSLLQFLNSSPTSWHAVQNIVKRLEQEDFIQLRESESWSSLQPGKKYYTTRNDSSLIAFILPKNKSSNVQLLGSHTDSPALKLKPKPLFLKDGMVLMALEVYGAPLLSSWFNRDLGIAGRVVIEDEKGTLVSQLVFCDSSLVTLPQLAIHLDRDVNEKGFVINKQEGLNGLVGLSPSLPSLEELLNISGEIISHDLFLFPFEEAKHTGDKGCFISGYRLDNLASVYGSLEAFIKQSPANETIQMIALWDHEEIGSQSYFSAGSPFFRSVLERVAGDMESYHQILSQSLCLSIDMAHATHPNHQDKHEPRHPIRLGEGIAIKHSAGYRYATDSLTAAPLIQIAKKNSIPLQHFVTHGNIPAGSTIGPIHAGATGMPTVDIEFPNSPCILPGNLSQHKITLV